MTFSWLGRFLSEVLKAGGVTVAVSILFGVISLVGLAWYVRFKLKAGIKIKEARIELDRDKFAAEQRHIQKLEGDGNEWRKFIGNHMGDFRKGQEKMTEAMQEMRANDSRISAKLIESINILHVKIDGIERAVNK